MSRVLVVCYSRSGSTLQVARELAALLDADLDQIQDTHDRSGPAGYVRSAFEALARGLPSIRTRIDPAQYDLVVLGTPVWTGSLAAPMRSFLFSHRHALKRIAAFALMGGVGAEAALTEIRALCSDEHAPTCALFEGDVKTGRHRRRLADFAAIVARVRDATSTQHAAA